jgi:hypothetical protein
MQTGMGAEGPTVFTWASRHYIWASHLTGKQKPSLAQSKISVK